MRQANWKLSAILAVVVAGFVVSALFNTPSGMTSGGGYTRPPAGPTDQPPCMFLSESRTAGPFLGTSARTVACYDSAGAHIQGQPVCSTKGPRWLVWVESCRAWASGSRFNVQLQARSWVPFVPPTLLNVRVYLDRRGRDWSGGTF